MSSMGQKCWLEILPKIIDEKFGLKMLFVVRGCGSAI